jgi:hypothetical protein
MFTANAADHNCYDGPDLGMRCQHTLKFRWITVIGAGLSIEGRLGLYGTRVLDCASAGTAMAAAARSVSTDPSQVERLEPTSKSAASSF